jgi:hypothetical protein
MAYHDEVHNLKAWTVTLQYEECLDVCIREICPMLNTLKVDIKGEIGPKGLTRLIDMLQKIAKEANK